MQPQSNHPCPFFTLLSFTALIAKFHQKLLKRSDQAFFPVITWYFHSLCWHSADSSKAVAAFLWPKHWFCNRKVLQVFFTDRQRHLLEESERRKPILSHHPSHPQNVMEHYWSLTPCWTSKLQMQMFHWHFRNWIWKFVKWVKMLSKIQGLTFAVLGCSNF